MSQSWEKALHATDGWTGIAKFVKTPWQSWGSNNEKQIYLSIRKAMFSTYNWSMKMLGDITAW